MEILIFSLGEKGFNVVNALNILPGGISITCIIGRDQNVLDDYSDQLRGYCEKNKIKYYFRNEYPVDINDYDLFIAIGWRWMIENVPKEKLIVFHDSLLPKYRGFAPLVSALINKERMTGVTALIGSKDYDTGNIILQRSMNLYYPTSIKNEIQRISKVYASLAIELVTKLQNGSINLTGYPQDESCASYSLWRDEDDYSINWHNSSEDILHFIECVGNPYFGASCMLNGQLVRIHKARLIEDVKIENRMPGKVIFKQNGLPVMVCGTGLILLEEVRNDKNINILPLGFFRAKFC
jgi:methionyl-tRNA formyltransferase